ncbi:MAG: outer membrane protein assembly factor BamD [Puniceicoccaceae bacterium]|nr:MAG: outer membrane protein assembly factor BamD [Puniceicoccaceae bacterium]
MTLSHLSRAPLFFAAFLLFLPLAALQAQLRWEPGLGYVDDQIPFVGLLPEEAREALGWLNQGRFAEEDGSYITALRHYRRVFRRHPNSAYAPEALYRTGRVREERRQFAKAFEAYERVARAYPDYPRFNHIIGQMYNIAQRLQDGERMYAFGVIPGFRNRDRAINFFERVVIVAPYNDFAPLALMNAARGYQRARRSLNAIDALDRFINVYPDHMLAPEAYLKLAEAHAGLVDGPAYDQGATREALSYFEDFLIIFPNHPSVARAEDGLAEMNEVLAESKMILADFYFFRRDNYRAARVFYNEAITVAPNSEAAALARKRLERLEAAEERGPRRRFLGLF